MVPADSRRISRVPRYSGAGWLAPRDFAYGAFTRCGPPFQKVRLSFEASALAPVLQPRMALCNVSGLGSCAFARHYLRNHYCFLFLRVMRCFSSPGLLHALHGGAVACVGLPHSEIRGSGSICLSPRLIAAYHVLRRLQEPRHPSCALFSFLCFFSVVEHPVDPASMCRAAAHGKKCFLKFDLLVES